MIRLFHKAKTGDSCAAVLVDAIFTTPRGTIGIPSTVNTAQGRLAAQMEPGASLLQYSHLDDGLYLTHGVLPEEKYFVLLNVAFAAGLAVQVLKV